MRHFMIIATHAHTLDCFQGWTDYRIL